MGDTNTRAARVVAQATTERVIEPPRASRRELIEALREVTEDYAGLIHSDYDGPGVEAEEPDSVKRARALLKRT